MIACFTHGFTLRLADGQVIHCGADDLVPGPLNVVCSGWPDGACTQIEPGMVADCSGARLRLAALELDLAGASIWRPPRVARVHSVQAIRAHATALTSAALARAPAGGLFRAVVAQARETPVERAALAPIEALREWLARVSPASPVAAPGREIARLLGLGEGLTPSGDDVLVGALVALSALELVDAARVLGEFVQRHVDARTGTISAAYLRAAMLGEAVAPVHACVVGLIAGTAWPEHCLDELARFGHTSGWDALAGVLLVVRSISGR